MQIERTHDSFYALEASTSAKQNFIEIANLIEDSGLQNESIADIGCAIGAFPWYLKRRFPLANVAGYEYSNQLVLRGKEVFPGLNLTQADILDEAFWLTMQKKYSVVTMVGVLSIFDSIYEPLNNVKKILKDGGKFYIFGLFNEWDIDVNVKYKPANSIRNVFESGWNITSHKTIKSTLENVGFSSICFHKFDISVDLYKNYEDPVRSWTETLSSGERQIVNGLCLKQPQYIVEATA